MSTRTITLLMALAINFVIQGARAQTTLSDDFNDGNDDGWTSFELVPEQPWGPGTFDASSGAYHIGTTGVVNGPLGTGVVGATWGTSSDPRLSDGAVCATVRTNNEGTDAAIHMRFDPILYSGYGFALQPETGGFYFFRTDPGLGGPPGRFEPFTVPGLEVQTGDDWNLEMKAVGDQFSLKAWRLDQSEPTSPQMTFIDSTYSTGRVAISSNAAPGWQNSATFDDISFTPVPEPSSSLGLLGLAVVSFGIFRGKRRLGPRSARA